MEIKMTRPISLAALASLLLFITVSAVATSQGQWEVESNHAEMIHDKTIGLTYVLEQPELFRSQSQKLPMLTADSGWFSETVPTHFNLAGNVRISTKDWIAYTDHGQFNLTSGVFETDGTLNILTSDSWTETRGQLMSTITFFCVGGHMIVDGEDQGEVTEDDPVDFGGGISWWCQGDTLMGRIQFKEK
jgi:hypothetical protein